jgi:hypothetical protein
MLLRVELPLVDLVSPFGCRNAALGHPRECSQTD